MSGYNFGIVIVRLFSVYLAITSVQSFFIYLPSFFHPATNWPGTLLSAGFWLTGIAILIPALCAYWIWMNATRFVPEQGDTEEAAITSAQLMLIGVTLLGLYFLVLGLISMVRTESSLVAAGHFDSSMRTVQRMHYLAQVLISLPMVLGRRRLSQWLLRFKYFGTGHGQ